MALINPSGVVCLSTQPIVKHYFDYSIKSPTGIFAGKLNLEDLKCPALKQTISTIEYTPFNSVFPVPGIKQAVKDASFTFRFLDGTKGFQFWKSWFKMVYDPEKDAVGLFKDIIGDAVINVYKMTGSRGEPAKYGTIRINDCWPTSIGPDDLDMMSDGEIFTYSVTLVGLDVEADFG